MPLHLSQLIGKLSVAAKWVRLGHNNNCFKICCTLNEGKERNKEKWERANVLSLLDGAHQVNQSSSSFFLDMYTDRERERELDTESICINEILMDSDACACVAKPLTTIGAIMCSTLLFELLAAQHFFLLPYELCLQQLQALLFDLSCCSPNTGRPSVNTVAVNE